MAQRDPIAEILAVSQRRGRRGLMPSSNDLSRLKERWATDLKEHDLVNDLLPARIVTLIEVFSRSWVEILIDHGAPYVERAAKLKVSIKYDFAIARSLHGRSISLGQMISHSVSLSNMEALAGIFGVLIDQDLFYAIASTRSRVSIERLGASVAPIVSDIVELRKLLARLFEVRHILIHEFPKDRPYASGELDKLFDAAIMFTDALDEHLTQLLYRLYPITQQGMNRAARERHEEATRDLSLICQEVAEKSNSKTIFEVQKAWETLMDAEAARQSEHFSGGTMRAMIYHSAAERVTRSRIDELRSWLEGWEDRKVV